MNFLKYLYFFTSSSFYASISFLSFLSSKKQTDVFFYYPQSFNSELNYPHSLAHLIESVENNRFSFTVIEEPNIYVNIQRSQKVIPFDFIWFLVILLRKFYRGNNYNLIDVKIGRLLSKILFVRRDVKNIITVTQSFQSFFRGLFPYANLYDYQHGLISSNYYGYINGDSIAEHLTKNESKVLLYGQAFKNKLLEVKGGEYFYNQAYVIGSIYKDYKKPRLSFNGNILHTLQFTDSHSDELNKLLLKKTIDFFEAIKSEKLNINIYLKNHPRFNDCINTKPLFNYDFVKNGPQDLNECLEFCTLHITEYSSVLLDSIRSGVPSLLTAFTEEMNIYEKEYLFPSNELSLLDNIKEFRNGIFYQKKISEQIKWSKKLYEPYNEKHFIDIIK